MENNQNVKIVKLITGDDVVCVLPVGKYQTSAKSPLLKLERPLQIKYVPQITPTGIKDYIALIKWAAYTSDFIITIPKDKIITITVASKEMIKSYHHIVKSYSNPITIVDQNKYKTKELTDEENAELNDIFNDFEDDPNTLH